MSVYLYRPPMRRELHALSGSKTPIYGMTTSTCVYRKDGTWYNTAEGSDDIAAQCDIDDYSRMRLFFTKPMVIPGRLKSELEALQAGDPNWKPAEFVLM